MAAPVEDELLILTERFELAFRRFHDVLFQFIKTFSLIFWSDRRLSTMLGGQLSGF
jgi:hypothetical protein